MRFRPLFLFLCYLMLPESLLAFDQDAAIRSMAAAALCLVAGLIIGRHAIAWLKRHFREPIKSISPTVVRLHQHKSQTPTMGGLFIVAGVVVSTLFCGDLHDIRLWFGLLTAACFATIGLIDDLVKLRTSRRGISARGKLLAQIGVAIPIALLLMGIEPDANVGSLAANVFVLILAANAVNLTDGLDGLAGGCGLITSATFAVILLFSNVPQLGVVAGALSGALAAFLYFNRYPARVFMGDTGSQAIGGLLGYFAIVSGGWWVFAIVGGVFLIEVASVVLQLTSYQLRGKRFFLCAPLHHHFQFAGWSEPKIVRLFWVGSLVFSVSGLGFAPAQFNIGLLNKSSSPDGNLSTRSGVQQVHAERKELNLPTGVAALVH